MPGVQCRRDLPDEITYSQSVRAGLSAVPPRGVQSRDLNHDTVIGEGKSCQLTLIDASSSHLLLY